MSLSIYNEFKFVLSVLIIGVCGLPTTLIIEYLVAKYGTVSELEYWFSLPNNFKLNLTKFNG